MAKVTLSPMVADIRGKVGDYVFRRSPDGQLVLSKVPDMSGVKWSKAQKAYRQRFKKAIAYAKAAMSDSKVRAVYEKMAAKENKLPFRMAVSDYLKGNDLLAKK